MKSKSDYFKFLICVLILLKASYANAQINPGKDFDLQGYIDQKISAGETTIVVPPGRYRVQPIGNTHLKFENKDNVTIIADNVEMICTETVKAIEINNCNNFKLKGLSVDFDPLPFTQGEIVAMSPDKRILTVDLIDGYPSNIDDNKLEIYDPVTGELSTRTYYGFSYDNNTEMRRVVFTKNSSNSSHTEEIGDIIVIGSRGNRFAAHSVVPTNCKGLVLEDVTLYAGTTFGFFELYCDGSKYINCKVIRRPLETDIKPRGIRRMRSNNADAFHIKFGIVGPSFVGCEAAYNGDDGIIIGGVGHLIMESNGNELTVVGFSGGDTGLSVGETVELSDYSGVRIPNAKITNFQTGRPLTLEEKAWIDSRPFYGGAAATANASTTYTITIDRSVDLPRGSVINSAEKVCNGFEIRNCKVGHNRARGLFIKASNGIITGNTLVGSWIKGMMIAPEYNWLGAASGSNLLITDNIISGTHDTSIGVFSTGGDGTVSPIGAHDNITITGNSITNSTNPAIVVTSTSNLCVENNTIESTDNSLFVNNGLWGRNTNPDREIYTENVEFSDCSIKMVNLTLNSVYEFLSPTNTVQLSATIVPEEFPNPDLVWSSSNPAVATVDENGLVTAVSNGEAVITAATIDGAFSTTCAIEVGDNNSQIDPGVDFNLNGNINDLLDQGQTESKCFSIAGFYSVDNSHRKVFNFNPGWRFLREDAEGAQEKEFDDSLWEAANLPHGLEILGENASGGRNYQGVAWYRKRFDVAKSTSERVYLYFEAVMGKCEVWVNGQKVAEHFGGYLPFAADITDIVTKDGAENMVAVRADNSDSDLYPPGKPQGNLDFTYLGGIYRDVFLIQTSPVHVTLPELSNTVAGGGVFFATLDVNGNEASLEARTEVINHSSETQKLIVKTTLEDAAGKIIKTISQNLTLKAGASEQLSKRFKAENVRLWHPDDPYLHFFKTEVINKGKVVDCFRTRFGIRLFEMRGAEGLYVNKEYIGKKLIGANRHQDYTYVGNALPNSGQWRDAKLLRQGGCNVVRAAHYPLDPAFYDACDEFGILVTTANPGWQFFNFEDPIFEQRLYEDTRALVRRDRHVASMFLWETAINETPNQPGHVMSRMHQIAHEEYPFPGLFTVADSKEAAKGGLDVTYHGSDRNIPSFTREYGDGGEVDNFYSQNATTRVKMEWGEKALLEQSLIQADYLNKMYPTWQARMGGSLWCGIDHQRGYHPDPFWGGLLNGLRIPRYTYFLYQSQYDPDYKVPGVEVGPILFITHELTQISPSDVVIYSNCDEVRLTWLGEVVGTQKPASKKEWESLPHPPFVFEDVFDFSVINTDWRSRTREIEMVAEGLIDGEVVVRVVKPYAEKGLALQFEVSDEGMTLVADGSDFVPVRAFVVDRDGTKKVLAREEVYFEVNGPAEVIGGLGNKGNPARTTSMGIATALARAGTKPGKITVTAYAEGLESASITFESVEPTLSLLFDEQYFNASKKPGKDFVVIESNTNSDLPSDVKKLQEEVERLRIEVTSKHQDIMDLRSRLGEEKMKKE